MEIKIKILKLHKFSFLVHAGLAKVVIVAVHLVIFCAGWVKRIFLLKALYCQSPPLWLKVVGWVAPGIILSSPGTGVLG